ncbi:MAG: phosphoglycerate kinase [Candidatus Sungbacteria bacterium]|nr:phosphoglycerate kinase [Candidatus Sungbacteria bacterium]
MNNAGFLKKIGVFSPSVAAGKRVLIRADFDVDAPKGRIPDDLRILRVLPVIHACLKAGARVRLIAHRGRPHGTHVKSLSLRPVAKYLERALKRAVPFVSDPFADGAERTYEPAPCLLFENIRFWPGEETNDDAFGAELARWGDLYINEAFANSHRAHASMVALAAKLPAYMGPALYDELRSLQLVRDKPKRPLVAILGGAKLETKMPLLKQFLKTADAVIIGGVLANTIYAFEGDEIGKSRSEAVPAGRQDKSGLNTSSLLRSKKLHIPSDVVVVKSLRGSSRRTVKDIESVDPDDYIVDIGERSMKHFSELLNKAGTIVWNGPFGYTEVPEFARGTKMLARAIARAKAISVVGGGDVIAAVGAKTLLRTVTHVSAGGGAMLAFLTGEKLPGVEALRR